MTFCEKLLEIMKSSTLHGLKFISNSPAYSSFFMKKYICYGFPQAFKRSEEDCLLGGTPSLGDGGIRRLKMVS